MTSLDREKIRTNEAPSLSPGIPCSVLFSIYFFPYLSLGSVPAKLIKSCPNVFVPFGGFPFAGDGKKEGMECLFFFLFAAG